MPDCPLYDELCEAAANGDEDACTSLIARGASATATDDDGWTALHSAVAADSPRICALLISHGADQRAVADVMLLKLTPMQHAVFSGCVAVVDYFVRVHEEDLGQLSANGSTLDELAKVLPKNGAMLQHIMALRSAMTVDTINASSLASSMDLGESRMQEPSQRKRPTEAAL
jgi:ankyrin repeat protein